LRGDPFAGIQSSAEGTIGNIEIITQAINEINQIVSTIAAAVEEQSATTREISGNVGHAAQGLEKTNDNVS
jgi:methyl-accepting chemotaxis protein